MEQWEEEIIQKDAIKTLETELEKTKQRNKVLERAFEIIEREFSHLHQKLGRHIPRLDALYLFFKRGEYMKQAKIDVGQTTKEASEK